VTVTLSCLAFKLLFGDKHTNIITHGYHIVKLIFHMSEKQQSDGSDFDGNTNPVSLSKDKNWLWQCHSICLPIVNNFE